MRITTASRQEAGECADALRRVMKLRVLDECVANDWGTHEPILTAQQKLRLRDLLTALEDAERWRAPAGATHDLGGEGG